MFGRLLEERAMIDAAALWGSWGEDRSNTYAGVAVTPASSMQLLTVYGCVKLIADSISTLPVDCYRKTSDGQEAIAPPAWLDEPTIDLNFTEWCTQLLLSLLLQGNAYIAVLRNERQQIVELVPLDPAKVQVTRRNSRKVYIIDGRDFTGEIVHIKGMMWPGSDVGMSPVEHARQVIGLGVALTEYGSTFFERGAWMPGHIEIPGDAQPGTMKDIAEGLARKLTRKGKGMPAVLKNGAKWVPAGIAPEQSQFLGTRQFTAAEIAGQMFLIDPNEFGIPVEGSNLTYNNLESRNVRLLQRPLLPWIVRLETAISHLMYQPRFMKFNQEALKRGDMKARWDTYFIAAGINKLAQETGQPPVMSTEEMRRFENWNPIKDYPPPAAAASPDGGAEDAA